MLTPCALFLWMKTAKRMRSIDVRSWECAHGSGPAPDLAEASFDGVGGSDTAALGKGGVAEAGEQVVEVVAQAGDGLGVGLFPGTGEAACGTERLGPVGGVPDGVEGSLDGAVVGLADLAQHVPDFVRPAALQMPG